MLWLTFMYTMSETWQEETQKTLESFLQNFVRTFKDWTPVEHVQAAELLQAADNDGSLHDDSGKTVVGCIQGHPTKVIVGLIRELKAVIQAFTACKFQQHGSYISERKDYILVWNELMPCELHLGIPPY